LDGRMQKSEGGVGGASNGGRIPDKQVEREYVWEGQWLGRKMKGGGGSEGGAMERGRYTYHKVG
jgi:hypothetical protein